MLQSYQRPKDTLSVSTSTLCSHRFHPSTKNKICKSPCFGDRKNVAIPVAWSTRVLYSITAQSASWDTWGTVAAVSLLSSCILLSCIISFICPSTSWISHITGLYLFNVSDLDRTNSKSVKSWPTCHLWEDCNLVPYMLLGLWLIAARCRQIERRWVIGQNRPCQCPLPHGREVCG